MSKDSEWEILDLKYSSILSVVVEHHLRAYDCCQYQYKEILNVSKKLLVWRDPETNRGVMNEEIDS